MLDWLSGGKPSEPAPQTPPPAPEEEAPLDWLAGDAAPAPGPVDGPAGPPALPEPRPAPVAPPAAERRPARITPGAAAFADVLREAMTLELQVLDYEQSTLGAEPDPDALQSYRRQRWERLQADLAGFRQKAGQMSLRGLETPRPDPGTGASREVLALLSALERAYESSRTPRTVEQFMELNREFLRTADWAVRDRAVQARDELVAREVGFTRLMQDAAALLAGTGDPELLTSAQEALARLAPEAAQGGDDLAVLVLRHKELREQVMAEVSAVITAPQPAAPPPATDEELRPRVAELQAALLDAGELRPVLEEQATAETQLAKLDEQLQQDMPLDRKMFLVGKRTEIQERRNAAEARFLGTEPDPVLWDQLVEVQDELIRRRQLDLGPAAVLYGARVQALRDVLAEGLPDSSARWKFLEQQRELIELLDGLRPAENPLLGIAPPDLTGMALMQEAKQKLAAQKAAQSEAAAAGAGAKGGKKAGLKKPAMTPKPKKAPPKKAPPKKKGKGKKGPF